jgi:hypothetical protein
VFTTSDFTSSVFTTSETRREDVLCEEGKASPRVRYRLR